MITIGVLEDFEAIYYPWTIAVQSCHAKCQTLWFSSFEDCLAGLDQIDILVADWEIEDRDLRETETLDDYIEQIAEKFKGPIVLNSVATPPEQLKKYFAKTLRSKDPPDIDEFLESLKPLLSQVPSQAR